MGADLAAEQELQRLGVGFGRGEPVGPGRFDRHRRVGRDAGLGAGRAVLDRQVPRVGVAELPLVDERRAVGGARVGDPGGDVEVEAHQLGVGARRDAAVARPEDAAEHHLHLVGGELLLRLVGVEGEDAGRHLLGRVADRPPALPHQFEPEGVDVLEREAVALGVGAVEVRRPEDRRGCRGALRSAARPPRRGIRPRRGGSARAVRRGL